MKNRVITISREFGSGGRTIGKKAAEKLGIPCYDAEIIQKMAAGDRLCTGLCEGGGRVCPGRLPGLCPFQPDVRPHQRGYSVGVSVQGHYRPCRKGPCVIVGRCADYILQDTADCLKVFIHADLAFRAKRIVEVYGEREQSPEERLRDKDKRRAGAA